MLEIASAVMPMKEVLFGPDPAAWKTSASPDALFSSYATTALLAVESNTAAVCFVTYEPLKVAAGLAKLKVVPETVPVAILPFPEELP